METVSYLYDKQGNQTALQINLQSFKKHHITDINSAQIELLKLFASGFPDEYLEELKKVIGHFLVEKILDQGDKVWQERNYTEETFENFVAND